MIKTLTLTDFRNHASGRIKTGNFKNIIITGPNGGGKTSILEAISTCAPGGGLRNSASAEMVRIGGTGGFGVVLGLENETEISVSYKMGDAHRRVRVDGDSAALADLSRYLRIMWITPREDHLFADATADRRAFFDRLVSGFDAAHSGRTARLSKLLSMRAFALKSGGDDKWLSSIELQIAGIAVAIAAARVKYAGEVNWFLGSRESGVGNRKNSEIEKENSKSENFNTISDSRLPTPDYSITISGMLEEKLAAGGSASDAEREYAGYLSQNRELVADKMTILGPHRTDFGMFNSCLDLPVAITSTGQQKSAILALICAHAKLVRTKTGARPVVLLDEVAAHIDASARAAFFKEMAAADAQVWITGLEQYTFRDVPDTKFISCDNGMISDSVSVSGPPKAGAKIMK